MCRLTNKFNPRNVENTSNQTPEEKWQDLINGNTKTSKNLHKGFKILVFLMLTHTLFRMFIPKNANIESSLGYAMFLPHEFLEGDNQLKVYTMFLSVIITIIIIALDYSQGANAGLWVAFASVSFVSIVVGIYGYSTSNKAYIFGAGLTLLLTLIALFIDASEKKDDTMPKHSDPNRPTRGGENPYKSQNKSYKGAFWFALSLFILSIIIGILSYYNVWFLNNNIIPYSIAGAISSAIMMMVLQVNPQDQNTGQNLFNWYIPNSFKPNDILLSGFAYNIYAVVIGALLTKIGAGSFTMAGGVAVIILASVIIQSIWDKDINKEKDKDGNEKDTISDSWPYYTILTLIFAFYMGIGSIKYMEWFNLSDNYDYAIPFLISTMFGVLPLAVFLIIINYSIASFAPSMALFFLVLYRVSGFLVARDPDSGFGKVILAITGKSNR